MTDIPGVGTESNVEAIPAGDDDLHYWYSLIGERVAAAEIDVVPRTLQGWRQKGGGPRFVRLSKRCVKYRRIDLKIWADERLRSSTSDPGPEPHDPVPDIRSAAQVSVPGGANVVSSDSATAKVRHAQLNPPAS